MQFLDPHHPFFKPLWVRILVVLVPLVWAGIELYNGSQTWAMISLALGFYAGLQLFWVFYKTPGKGDEQ
ncbi:MULTISPECIES: hypothetical protein [Rhizobium/Agrobacterium group]|uniref:DUF3329 domain-containing protein n=2 Tax=Rhizobium/Agrobacterium group TaxID=227290 RepID=B9JY02_ALLAM|nr:MULTISPECIES: hypothetical protein [Rhizobium/Agrobacterium group]ACM35032.1 conserved hypothetical protein [Allorhizobium ampelinum S4]MBF2717643.1 hypothetical protein [Agrobacterium vitis]MCF1435827.1 hypothetical protein [Allorhizobium ampelinum]MCF1447412.1 hypothetical protein [Allorhizobium ampelinum]MCF1462468.1 hypothetical protein [Allorhizobium ampelinum]